MGDMEVGSMRITEFGSVDDLARAAVARIGEVVSGNPRAVIGWPSGRTTVPVLHEIARSGWHGAFRDATIVMMDDYAFPDGDGYSNCDPAAHYSCQTWIETELAPALGGSRVLVPDAAYPADYENRIADAGGIDLFLVGVGASDAHIAFNPPGTPADSITRVIELADSTRRDNLGTFPQFGSLTDVPRHGVTVGLATITSARAVIGIAHGLGKAGAVQRVLDAGGFTPDLPATALYLHPDAEFMMAAINGEEQS
jgi:glucosamine-6-phosphate deaminase